MSSVGWTRIVIATVMVTLAAGMILFVVAVTGVVITLIVSACAAFVGSYIMELTSEPVDKEDW